MTRIGGEVVPKNFPDKPQVVTETIRKVDYDDIDRMCQQAFGLTSRYQSILADMELNNDASYSLHIPEWDKSRETLKQHIDGEFGYGTFDDLIRLRGGVKVYDKPHTLAMLTYAAGVGWMEPGDYTLEVSY